MQLSRDRIQTIEWSDIDIFIANLIRWIKDEGYDFDGVYYNNVDSAVVARMISDELHIPILRYPTFDSLLFDIGEYNNSEMRSYYNQGYIMVTLFNNKELEYKPYFNYIEHSRIYTVLLPWEV